MAQNTEPDSPPPPIPMALTPGIRASALSKLHTQTLSATLSAISYAHFSACFPTIAAANAEALKVFHGNMVQRLGELAGSEFEKIVEMRGMVGKLNELEGLIAGAQARRSRSVGGGGGEDSGEVAVSVAPHTLPPIPLLNLHTSSIYTSQQSTLNAKLQTLSSQNATLFAEIQKQRKEIETLLALAEGGVKDLDSAGKALGEQRVLLGEMRMAQVEVDAMDRDVSS